MITRPATALMMMLSLTAWHINAQNISIETAPPVVVVTTPRSGEVAVNPALTEIRATFSKPMRDGSWSWSTWGEEHFPELNGDPHYLADRRTCVLPVKLEPDRCYAIWLNSEQFRNFKDQEGRPAIPYLLTFTTGSATASEADTAWTDLLNEDQQAVITWTDRQFGSYFDDRTFAGWQKEDIGALEARSIDSLSGPRSREYDTAINTLAALRSTNALPRLRELAFERIDKNNRDRWMSVRTLGILRDQESIPELIHLVYHGNQNTHWWAQIVLVQLTGQNFGGDWESWGAWWNDQGGQPAYTSEIIRWWDGQAETVEEMKETLAEGDRNFLDKI